jgi:hypothetical protein
MDMFRSLAAAAVTALLTAGSMHAASADTLVQPVPAARAQLVENITQPVKPAKPAVARPALSNRLAQPVQAEARPACPCGAPPPVTQTAPDGSAITGDLSGLRPSERLLGREQALRSEFGLQIHSGERPWLPIADDDN